MMCLWLKGKSRILHGQSRLLVVLRIGLAFCIFRGFMCPMEITKGSSLHQDRRENVQRLGGHLPMSGCFH